MADDEYKKPVEYNLDLDDIVSILDSKRHDFILNNRGVGPNVALIGVLPLAALRSVGTHDIKSYGVSDSHIFGLKLIEVNDARMVEVCLL